MSPEDPLDELSSSVLDGVTVDWDRAETDAALSGQEGEVRVLRDLARIASFNRALQNSRQGGPGLTNLPSPNAAAQPGFWGPFTLLEIVGTGATGEVWRAWDASLQRDVAIKFLQSNVTGEGGVNSVVLLDEARAVARVRHPAVVTIHGIAEYDGRAGLWMEFLRGPTLAAEIERRGGLPPREVARIGVQLTEALKALDKAGLVHRDIKPANVVLESDGRAILADFGLGWRRTLLDSDAPRKLGTPLFMSPSLLAGEPPTPRTDVYALGVTLRWALTGRPPFQARTLAELKLEAERGPSPKLLDLCPQAPPALVTAIERAMAPPASEALFNAAAMGALLRIALGETESNPFGAAPRDAAAPSVVKPAALSIAVLPFMNHSRAEADEYFSDGLADELLNVLARIRGLRVAARTSSFQFKGKHEDLAVIGRKLNVATVLEGGVRKSGSRIRISVRLVNVTDGYQLWSETYDRTLEDIFAVQDDIAQSVVKELRTAFLGAETDSSARREVEAEVATAVRGRGQNAEAHRLYLQGRYFIDRLTRGDTAKGVAYVKQALELDPASAISWAVLGIAFTREADLGWTPVVEGFRRARGAVERALSLEPDLAEAHAGMGRIRLSHDWDLRGAENSLRRALELAPRNAAVLQGAAELARNLGRFSEAIELNERAMEQDPLSARTYTNLGIAFYAAEQFSKAESLYRKALDLWPDRVGTHAALSLTLLAEGRGGEALEVAMQEPDEAFRLWPLAIIYHALERRSDSDEALRELIEKYADDSAYQIAEVVAARGQVDTAFEWLERAYVQRDPGLLTETKASPHFRSLQSDPRWAVFLAKIGLAE